jgi:hypothetical protein
MGVIATYVGPETKDVELDAVGEAPPLATPAIGPA